MATRSQIIQALRDLSAMLTRIANEIPSTTPQEMEDTIGDVVDAAQGLPTRLDEEPR